MSKAIWVKLHPCKRGARRCKLETTHEKVTFKRDSCWPCALDCQSPLLKRQHTHLDVYQTPLHSQFSNICQLAEPALAPLSRALKEVLNRTGPNIVPRGTSATGIHPVELISRDQQFSQFSSHIIVISLDTISSVGQG